MTTKLYIPPPRPNLVQRPRLIEQLDDGLRLGHKLALISAPAGFGKTTLLCDWAHRIRTGKTRHTAPPSQVAWLSLDKGDNDPARFLAYFSAALRIPVPSAAEGPVPPALSGVKGSVAEGSGTRGTKAPQDPVGLVGKGILSALQSPGLANVDPLPPAAAMLTPLINEIASLPDRVVLILDDFHLIEAPVIHQALDFLLEHLPPRMHLCLAGRSDPPLTLARLRARGQLTELRAADLRFTVAEAVAFLNDCTGLDLSEAEVAALDARTEGWVAGLQMAALSLRGREDVRGFIQAFTGTHRFILEYLVEEVLDRQSPGIQEFVLSTSILDRMTASLCDAVRFGVAETPSIRSDAATTDGSNSQTLLIQLDRDNLFLIPLDDERRWYRYHHLFADLLRSRLAQTQPDRAPILHRRASEWYEEQELIVEAVQHAFAGGDLDRVARLVEGNALAMMGHGELTTVTRWLDALPAEMIRARPWLSIALAWALLYRGWLDRVESLLGQLERAPRCPGDQAQLKHLEGHITAIRAEAAYVRGDMPRTAALSRQALDCLPADDTMARGFAAAHLAYALYWNGDLAEAEKALANALAIARTTGDSHVALMVLCDLATVQIDRGQLRQVVATIESALELADEHAGRGGQQPPSSGHAYTYLSRVLLEWNDLDAALRYAQEGNALCKLWSQPETTTTSYHSLAKAYHALGDREGALNAIQDAKRLAVDLSPWISARAAAWEALIRLAAGDLPAAVRWSQESGLSADDQPAFQQRFLYRALARVLLAQGRSQADARLLDKALGLLSKLSEAAEAAGAIGFLIECLVLQAMAFQARGKMDQARAAVERALILAEPEGYVRTFVSEGEPMGRLLRQAAANGIALDYVRRLLSALENEQSARNGHSLLPEPLSAREVEVLRLLATGLANKEIAEALFIATGTVKQHLKSIYAKLRVRNRTEAASRARELGLL